MARASQPILLALLASPCQTGASARLLSAFLQGVRGCRIVRISLANLNIKPCRGCQRCKKNLRCPIPDDMQKIFSWLDRAGAVVLSTPVYFYGFPSSAKAVIDRCHPLWHDPVWRQKPKRPAFFLANCAASRNQEFNVILQEGRAFLNTVGFKIQAKLLVPGMDRKDANQRLRWAEKRARALARRWQPKPP